MVCEYLHSHTTRYDDTRGQLRITACGSPKAGFKREKIMHSTGLRSFASEACTLHVKEALHSTILATQWTLGDSNPGPSGYEPDALTN